MNTLSPAGLWSEQQQEWLRALGHEAWQLAPGPGAAPALPVETVAGTHAEPVAARRNAVAMSNNVTSPVPNALLLSALARAAGRSPQDDEFLGVLPELSSLHRNPAARRALWPRLRALRKRSDG